MGFFLLRTFVRGCNLPSTGLIALLARREGYEIRMVMGASGIIAALYAVVAFLNLEGSAGGRFDVFELVVIPLRAAIVSFYLAFTGVCFVTALRYHRRGRLLSLPGIVASSFFLSSAAAGLVFGGRLLRWSI